MMTREEALDLLKKYNKEEFHIHHGKMVEGTMRYFAEKLGYGDEAVELQDGHCGRDQQEQSCIANRRLPGADDPPECEQVDGL